MNKSYAFGFLFICTVVFFQTSCTNINTLNTDTLNNLSNIKSIIKDKKISEVVIFIKSIACGNDKLRFHIKEKKDLEKITKCLEDSYIRTDNSELACTDVCILELKLISNDGKNTASVWCYSFSWFTSHYPNEKDSLYSPHLISVIFDVLQKHGYTPRNKQHYIEEHDRWYNKYILESQNSCVKNILK